MVLGVGRFSTTIPGRPEVYTIDFVNWSQSNQTSGKTRKIRRASPEIVEKAGTIVFQLSPQHQNLLQSGNLGGILASCEMKLADIVQKACRTHHSRYATAKNTLEVKTPTLKVKGTPCFPLNDSNHSGEQLILEVPRNAFPIVGILTGVVRTAFSSIDRDVSPLSELGVSSLLGSIANPRLMILASQTSPKFGNTRDEVLVSLSHFLVWEANCKLFGGFLRDWVRPDYCVASF